MRRVRATEALIRVKKEEKEIWRGGRKNFEKSQRALLQRLPDASRGTGKEEEMEALARAKQRRDEAAAAQAQRLTAEAAAIALANERAKERGLVEKTAGESGAAGKVRNKWVVNFTARGLFTCRPVSVASVGYNTFDCVPPTPLYVIEVCPRMEVVCQG